MNDRPAKTKSQVQYFYEKADEMDQLWSVALLRCIKILKTKTETIGGYKAIKHGNIIAHFDRRRSGRHVSFFSVWQINGRLILHS